MKIHNCVRDAKLMELAELQAIDDRAKAVQANTKFYEQEQQTIETKENSNPLQKARTKKKKERFRSDEDRVLSEA